MLLVPMKILGLLLLAVPALAQETAVEELKPLERAHVAVTEVKKNFRNALSNAMKKGPAKAVDSCKIESPNISGKSASGKDTLEIGRTSHKLRNPNNAPLPWVKPLLEKWAKMKRTDMPMNELVELGPNHWGYVEPILVEAMCLNCHGGQLNEGVKAELKAKYPADQATGFKVGDFRGLFWAELRRLE